MSMAHVWLHRLGAAASGASPLAGTAALPWSAEGDAPDPALLEKTLHAYVPAERRIAHHRAVAALVAAGAKVYRAHPARVSSIYDTEDYYTLVTIDEDNRMTAAAWGALSELWDCRHLQVYSVSLDK